jgi:hypothetical protein
MYERQSYEASFFDIIIIFDTKNALLGHEQRQRVGTR